jgi:hypothetical protein
LFEKHKPPQTRLSSSSQLECDPEPRANRFNAERGQPSKGAETDLVRVKGEIQNIIAAVKQGLLHASMREALTELEERNSTLEKEIAATPLRPPPLHTDRPSANAEWPAK